MPIDVTKTQFFGGGKEEEPALLLSETTNVADIRVLEERLESSATQSPLASNAEYAREWYIDDQVERQVLKSSRVAKLLTYKPGSLSMEPLQSSTSSSPTI